MHVQTYTVTGPRVSELETALAERLEPKETHTGDGFAVLLFEEFEFWLTTSNMQVTVILDHQSDDTVIVKVTVGGGAVGIFNWTLGSEEKISRKFRPRVVRVFDDLDLNWRKGPPSPWT